MVRPFLSPYVAKIDTFEILVMKTKTSTFAYEIDKTTIAYEGNSTSAKYKYPNDLIEESKKTQWVDVVGNQDFQVWMKIAGFPVFRKLYGKINEPLEVGTKVLRFTDSKISIFGSYLGIPGRLQHLQAF